jgi:hypothetical protein
MEDDGLDVGEVSPLRVNLAGLELELVGGGVVLAFRVGPGEAGDGVDALLRQPGPVADFLVDADEANGPVVVHGVDALAVLEVAALAQGNAAAEDHRAVVAGYRIQRWWATSRYPSRPG